MKRFTAYRRGISQRDTHNALQKNADHEPQFEGVVWSDGTVTLRWLTACRSTSVWANLSDCLNIHGHPEYGTQIVWHDHAEPPLEWKQMCAHAASVSLSATAKQLEPVTVDLATVGEVGVWGKERCWCASCETKAHGIQRRMSVCPKCGSKRCPRAEHHDNDCRNDGEEVGA